MSGSAAVQRQLWGPRARDWASVQEGAVLPLYEAVLAATALGKGMAVLDVGCGSGLFALMAAKRGATVSGVDATPELLAIARERLPQADFQVADMESLPHHDAAFDVVTGFNSFQFAANPVNALREARRVARRGAKVVIAVWGKPQDCQAAAYLAAIGQMLPPPPPGAPGPFAFSDDGVLDRLVREAGLAPGVGREVDCPWVYPDLATAERGLLSAGPAVKAIQHSGEERVRQAVEIALEPFRTSSGGYRLENKFRYVIATA